MKLMCRVFGHKWDWYAGYEGWRVHQRAVCERCGKKYKDSVK